MVAAGLPGTFIVFFGTYMYSDPRFWPLRQNENHIQTWSSLRLPVTDLLLINIDSIYQGRCPFTSRSAANGERASKIVITGGGS